MAPNSFSLFLALRYLRPKRTFVSVITLFSILGVVLGVCLLVVVIAVMTGFGRELERRVLGFEPHIVVENRELLRNWHDIDDAARRIPGVEASAPFVQGPVIIESEGRVLTPVIRGIDGEAENQINDLKALIVQGEFDLSGDTTVIGARLAYELGATVGSKIIVYAPSNIRGIIDELRKEEEDPTAKKKTLAELKDSVMLPAELVVTGIFESGRYDYDANVLLVPLHIGQELWALGQSVHGISIRTTNPFMAAEVKPKINQILTEGAFAQTWMDRNQERFDAIRLERSMMFFILFFIIIVAAFCIMNTLITVTVQKRREIGIMKALGASVGQIVWVFLAQGMVVGFVGVAAGLGLGMTLVHYRNPFKNWLADTLHIQIFPASVYELPELPAEVVPQDVAMICVGAFIVCSIAALIPALFAARLEPVKALRYE